MRAMPAHTTLEFRLALAVGLLAMSALGTCAAGVPRVDRDYGHASQLGLVLHEGTKLEEGPTREPVTLFSAPSRDAIADALEVFEANSAIGALGGLHDLFGDAVVFVLAEPRFLGLGPLHGPADVLGPCALSSLGPHSLTQRLAPLAITTASGIDLLARELIVVFSRGDVDHAEIDAHEVSRGDRCGLRDVNCYQQEPLAVMAEYQVSLPLGMGEPLGLVLAHDDGDEHAAIQRQQAHSVDALEAHDSLVIGDRGVLAELGLDALVPLVRGADSFDRQLGHLGGQSEPLPDFLVGEVADLELVRFLASETLGGDPVAGLVEPFDDRAERSRLFDVGQELDLDRELHDPGIVDFAQTIKNGLKPWKTFPPLPLKWRGFHGLKPRNC